jgi:hypothetical protein
MREKEANLLCQNPHFDTTVNIIAILVNWYKKYTASSDPAILLYSK